MNEHLEHVSKYITAFQEDEKKVIASVTEKGRNLLFDSNWGFGNACCLFEIIKA